ncbi:four helix bundle protein [Pedobacter sp. Du54]|uniref:four helix bundle protein n=1 Tax=Pedobacter anseongensis TaxID=3133439 RepID=UPI0030B26BB0
MNKLTEIKIWNEAIDLTVDVYKATARFPVNARFGLTSQSRRAAVSISLMSYLTNLLKVNTICFV